jgi:hypothetical protein
MELAEKILNRLSISKPQRRFLMILFTTILVVRGKVNFRNLSRYSALSEKTYSRQFAHGFDFVAFNRQLINETIRPDGTRVVAFDPSFLAKAGKKTYGRDFFWNSAHHQAEKGLEVSVLSIVDLESNTGFTLSARQTAPTTAAAPSASPKPKPSRRKKSRRTAAAAAEETRIDLYLHHLRAVAPSLLPQENHLAVDGYFAKQKWIAGVEELGLYTIGKLRTDANMRFFYTGPKRAWGQGRQKTYAGKVDWQNLQGFEFVGGEEGIELYTQVLNHVSLKRTLRVVVVLDQRDPKHPRYALLFSTDLTLDARTIYRYYKARFQIEFIFRDAKQFTGLADCQARDADRLHFHFNASLTALNLAKSEQLQAHVGAEPMVNSIASVKAEYFNEHYLQIIFSMLALDPRSIKNTPAYQFLRAYGKIAA